METPISQPPHSNLPPRKIHWIHEIRQYGFAFLAIALPLLAAFTLYIFYQRGLFDLRTTNRALADAGAVLLGIVLLLGPLSRYFSFPDRYLQYRKEIGIIAFFFALAHTIISLFFLGHVTSFATFTASLNITTALGLAGAAGLTALFSISNERAAEIIGRKLWWHLQNWGVRFIFAFVFFHVYLMKWDGWLRWYETGVARGIIRPELPPIGILVGWFMAFVVLMRLAEFGGPRFFRIAWYVLTITLSVIFIGTFLWGMQFAK